MANLNDQQFKQNQTKKAFLILEDNSKFEGFSFGYDKESNGEVVFNTGMVGYPETLSDPSYNGQIVTLTYPLIGNYGITSGLGTEFSKSFESSKFHISGLIVYEIAFNESHYSSAKSLTEQLREQKIPAICGIDTRELTKKLRNAGTMQGKIVFSKDKKFVSTKQRHVVSEVSINEVVEYKKGNKRVGVVDCGCKSNIIRELLNRNISVVRVPWNFDVTTIDVDGVLFSNGPGDPVACPQTIDTAKKVINKNIPAFGICLGHQILALATGAKTYKLPFGHRSQNQPCKEVNGKKCYITSQNHGYAVDEKTLNNDFEPWFINLNDNSNEGMRSKNKKIMSVQFHPEAMPGPVDTGFLFDEFVSWL